jgi:hypothetical protein
MRGRDELERRVSDNEGRCVIQKAAIIIIVKVIMSYIKTIPIDTHDIAWYVM